MTRAVPVPRPAARVLLIDSAERVLLFQYRDPDGEHWSTPGGAVERGETVPAAAVRELAEETGLIIGETTLEGPVWTRRETWYGSVDGLWFDSRETYFVVRVDAHEVDTAGFLDYERELTVGYRWWTVAELAATGQIVYPVELADRLPEILAGRWVGPPRAIV